MTEEALKRELDEINARLARTGPADPKDARRKHEIISLLLTDGKTANLRPTAPAPKKSRRVTSFTRDRR